MPCGRNKFLYGICLWNIRRVIRCYNSGCQFHKFLIRTITSKLLRRVGGVASSQRISVLLRRSAYEALFYGVASTQHSEDKHQSIFTYNDKGEILEITFPQFMYSTAVSLKKKYTKFPCTSEFTKSGAVDIKHWQFNYQPLYNKQTNLLKALTPSPAVSIILIRY